MEAGLSKNLIRRLWIAAALLLPPLHAQPLRAATINAASASQTDVQAAVNSAVDGDRVIVPLGTQTWTLPVTVADKFITLQGAGIGQTVIVDETTNDSALRLLLKDGGLTRVTGFTFRGGAGAAKATGIISTTGQTAQLRIDNNRFETTRSNAIRLNGFPRGVADHNQFFLGQQAYAFYVFNGNLTGQFGDDAWSRPSPFGASDNFFIEDNEIASAPDTATWAIDGWVGGRYVFRHNRVTETNGVTAHGLASPGRYRSIVMWRFTTMSSRVPARLLIPPPLRSAAAPASSITIPSPEPASVGSEIWRIIAGLIPCKCGGSPAHDLS